LSSLFEYLKSFLLRSQPLLNLDQLDEEVDWSFNELWSALDADLIYCKPCMLKHLNILSLIGYIYIYIYTCFSSVIGNKNFSKQSLYDSHLKGKKHISALQKSNNSKENDNGSLSDSKTNLRKEITKLELSIVKYLEPLAQEVDQTKKAVERKWSLTLDEYVNRLV
jgi:splicing factor 3A subunit 3